MPHFLSDALMPQFILVSSLLIVTDAMRHAQSSLIILLCNSRACLTPKDQGYDQGTVHASLAR